MNLITMMLHATLVKALASERRTAEAFSVRRTSGMERAFLVVGVRRREAFVHVSTRWMRTEASGRPGTGPGVGDSVTRADGNGAPHARG